MSRSLGTKDGREEQNWALTALRIFLFFKKSLDSLYPTPLICYSHPMFGKIHFCCVDVTLTENLAVWNSLSRAESPTQQCSSQIVEKLVFKDQPLCLSLSFSFSSDNIQHCAVFSPHPTPNRYHSM